MIGKIVKLFKLPTPKIGRTISKLGLSLTGTGAAGLAVSAQLPEVPDSWMEFGGLVLQILSAVTLLIGTILTGAGAAQVKEDPDQL